MLIYAISEQMITGLGCTVEENFRMLCAGNSGLTKTVVPALGDRTYCLSGIDRKAFAGISAPLRLPLDMTWLEMLMATSMELAIAPCPFDPEDPDVLVVIASTKGNIDLLDSEAPYPPDHPIHLTSTAARIQAHFGFARTPSVLSHACTSGVMAVIMASRLLTAGAYRYAVVTGVDILSPFTISGFDALGAIDPEPCKPYDAKRAGINLGEGCGTIVLSSAQDASDIMFTGAGNSNDANHISGPSRTGAGLVQCIRAAMQEAGISSFDHISAHGTATSYNDEMEAQAFHQLGLQDVPLNSAKGYWGHTLGAAGMIELIALMQSMRENRLFANAGYDENGLTLPLNIVTGTQQANLNRCLKTSSGFGGSNSAIIVQKA